MCWLRKAFDSRFAFANKWLRVRCSAGGSGLSTQNETNSIGDRRFAWTRIASSTRIRCNRIDPTWTISTRDDLHRCWMKLDGEILVTHEIEHANFFNLTDSVRSIAVRYELICCCCCCCSLPLLRIWATGDNLIVVQIRSRRRRLANWSNHLKEKEDQLNRSNLFSRSR